MGTEGRTEIRAPRRDDKRMKALVYDAYGEHERLRVENVDIPVPRDGEVLIAVRAAAVNSWDWDLLRGKPYMTRLGAFRKPRHRVLGADIAGVVVAVGGSAGKFRLGDEVFGDLSGCEWGGFAEYVRARETALTLKPNGTSFAEAAAIPQAAVLALQGLRDSGKLAKGQRVLINGAGGGVGTFAIQYAKLMGAEVTGVDAAGKLEMLRSVGADHVQDYKLGDFTADRQRYDLILDVVGTRSPFRIKRALSPGGTYVMIGGTTRRLLQMLLAGPIVRLLERKKLKILLHKPNHGDQLVWKELVETGKAKPVIDQQFTLDDGAEAFRYFGEGGVRGKLVVRIGGAEHP
ncbi:MAG: Alcohol dehydrogenase zinc-binding domain protein [Paenibacillus sp.]|nr:Alcohol dehydrogenase zinc-binding domain protein [Paenibacillus sp.]